MLDETKSAKRDSDDFRAIVEVRNEIDARLRKQSTTREAFFGGLIRRAIDEVLSLGEKRFSIEQLESPEKTYVGTRVEMLVRDELDVGRGSRADAQIAGHEVDIKWSKSLSWMIGPENLGTVCLGIGTDKSGELFSVGLFVPHRDLVRPGSNRDQKLSLSTSFYRERVEWIAQRLPTPPNFFAALDAEVREDILSQSSAQSRLRRLAELVPNVPIPRSAIEFASLNKDDPLRRVRKDAARRTPPLGDMVCLSERYGKEALEKLGVTLPPGHFYFVHKSRIDGSK
ncbi:NaeI family type II restriction endonuclease [Gemmatimonas sp.]|jgi:hypothetical protein|uniref:NaeI family type II restriction endonuclease n=1 Tax=Gemmatimonas sp. TaxID=1962908 RepID=UPI0031BCD80F|nr:hypothetical protein [Gemmatimonas sp.]